MRNYLLFICPFLLYSCSQDTTVLKYVKPCIPTIAYEFSEIPTLRLFDTLRTDLYQNEFDSIKYVKLEMTDDCIIGQHTNISIYENKIFVADRRTKAIYIYDMAGKFLYSINKTGQGGCEYSELSSVIFNDSCIYITDFMASKFLHYDIYGNCINERMNIKYSGSYIWPFSDSSYVEANCYRENPYELTFTDEKQNLKGCAMPYKTNLPISSGSFVSNKNNVYYCRHLNDTIFLINDISVTPYLCIGLYTKKTLDAFYSKAFSYKTHNEFIKFINLKAEIPVSYTFTESDNYWVFQFHDNKYAYTSIVERATFKSNTYIQRDFRIGKFYNILGIRGFYNNDWIIASLSEEDVNSISPKMIEEGIAELPNDLLKREIRTLPESNCNGLIMFFHIKKR